MHRGIWLAGVVFLIALYLVWDRRQNDAGRGGVPIVSEAPREEPRRISRPERLPGRASDLPVNRREVRLPASSASGTGAPTDAPVEDPEAIVCANRIGGECSFLHPSHEELLEMARCATVKFDYPPALLNDKSAELTADVIDTAAVTAHEQALILQVTEE